MKQNEFNAYIEDYISTLGNVNDRAKVNYFLRYLTNYFNVYMNQEIFDVSDVFSILDKDFLLDSITAYIKDTQPAKGVAEDYRRTIVTLFQAVCEKYEIKNDFFEKASEQRVFYEISKEWFDDLRRSESRECIPFEEFELLDEAIRYYSNSDNLENLILESLEDSNRSPDYYRQLVSAIALKLVQEYALSNETIAKLKITDLNIDSKLLIANGFELYLNNELISNFILYLKYRTVVVESTNCELDELFITRDGTPYLNRNGYCENGKLFALMQDTLHHTKVTGLRYKTIMNLVSKGANIYSLHQLTDVSPKKIAEICIEDKSSLENIFKGIIIPHALEPKTSRKGQIRCPYCGNYYDASSENWILIQIAGDEKKHLACRECRGLDGKYRY